jgi:hypothetical protein
VSTYTTITLKTVTISIYIIFSSGKIISQPTSHYVMTVGASLPVWILISVTSNAMCMRGASTTCKAVLCCYYYCCKVETLCLCGTAATNGPTAQPPDDTCVNMAQWRNDNDRENQGTQRKTYLSVTCPPQNTHGLPRAWTQASTVRSQWVIAWAMVLPVLHCQKNKPQ